MDTSSKTHKRKRSLQDTPVDLGKMRQARLRLCELKKELDGIEETERELTALMEHVSALEDILGTAKKPKLTFSSASANDLEKIGLIRRPLSFHREGIAELVRNMSPEAVTESPRLYERIQEIYEYVNMDFKAGSRMILDAVLLSLGKVTSNTNHSDSQKRSIAILPEMRIGAGEGVKVVNPITHYEVWLTGSVDYAVLKYVDKLDYKERLLSPNNSRIFALEIAGGRLFLVEAKLLQVSLIDFIPEAICQAIALSKVMNQNEVRFCLSNGQDWIFCVMKKDANDDKWTCYESTVRSISKKSAENEVREILQLVLEWLDPKAKSGLYTLVEELE